MRIAAASPRLAKTTRLIGVRLSCEANPQHLQHRQSPDIADVSNAVSSGHSMARKIMKKQARRIRVRFVLHRCIPHADTPEDIYRPIAASPGTPSTPMQSGPLPPLPARLNTVNSRRAPVIMTRILLRIGVFADCRARFGGWACCASRPYRGADPPRARRPSHDRLCARLRQWPRERLDVGRAPEARCRAGITGPGRARSPLCVRSLLRHRDRNPV